MTDPSTPECAEQWDTRPYTSAHVWRADHHQQLHGPCVQCGKPYATWRNRLAQKMNEPQRPDPTFEAWKATHHRRFERWSVVDVFAAGQARGVADAQIARDWHEGRSDGRFTSCDAAILAAPIKEV